MSRGETLFIKTAAIYRLPLFLPFNHLQKEPIFAKETIAEILTSNSVGTQCFFFGCNQDNDSGNNLITKKKICLVHQKRKLATIEINKFLI